MLFTKPKNVAVILESRAGTFYINYSSISRKFLKTKEGGEIDAMEIRYYKTKRLLPSIPTTLYFLDNEQKISYVFLITFDNVSFHPLLFEFSKTAKQTENYLIKIENENNKKYKQVGYAFVFDVIENVVYLKKRKIRDVNNYYYIEDVGYVEKFKALENSAYDKNNIVLFIAKYNNVFELLDLKNLNVLDYGNLKAVEQELTKISLDYKRSLEAYKRFTILLKDALNISSFWEKYGHILIIVLVFVFSVVALSVFAGVLNNTLEKFASVNTQLERLNNYIELYLNHTLKEKIITVS